MNGVYLGLGSNQNDPIQQLSLALQALKKGPHTSILRCSRFYRTSAVGDTPQEDFINAVVELTTMLTPWDLLQQLRSIEIQQGRLRRVRWGPRTLDLDILLYNHESVTLPDLVIPHAEMHKRLFVLVPLQELLPELILPNGKKIADTIRNLEETTEQRIHALNAPIFSPL